MSGHIILEYSVSEHDLLVSVEQAKVYLFRVTHV